ncbi:unnamed protein product [Urochloa humidicola]
MASPSPQPRQCNVDSSGSSNDGVLPHQDVLYEILLRVPARSLCRFRTVCKPWLSLLTDPQFSAAHAARHRSDPLFVVAVEDDSGTKPKVAEIKLVVVDTSGRAVKTVSTGLLSPLIQMRPHLDLLLLWGLSNDRRFFLDRKTLRLLDPATGAVSSLPTPNGIEDTLSTSFVLGRAVSSTGGHGEYKVLGLNRCLYATRCCKVLTVGGGGTWRAAPTPPVTIRAFDNGTVVANGVVYHLVGNNATTWSIAAFDLEAELWQPSLVQGPQPVPSIDGHAQPRRRLAVLNGCLAAVSASASIMDIWLLMGSGKRSKQCRVRTSSIQEHVWPSAMHVEPLWVLDDGRIALWMRAGNRTGALWMYDPRTGTCTKVAVSEDCLNDVVGVYTGNLLL